MSFELESGLMAAGLFVGLMLMLELGRRLGVRSRATLEEGADSGIGAVEACVYGLLGLLIAFTFQGASDRFDSRRALIAQEANAIESAWQRLDLLPETNRAAIRALFPAYLDSRIEAYRKIPDMVAVNLELAKTQRLQDQIWAQLTATREHTPQVIVAGVLPALNEMFDIVTTRTVATKTHPPVVVFVMLILLALVSALYAGHGMGGCRERSWIHVVGFAAVLAVTVYVIIDMEYPRLGLIRLDAYDQVLIELRESLR